MTRAEVPYFIAFPREAGQYARLSPGLALSTGGIQLRGSVSKVPKVSTERPSGAVGRGT